MSVYGKHWIPIGIRNCVRIVMILTFTLVWILMSWDCRRLHMSNAPISLAIRTASMTSTLTGTYCCHPCASTLVVMRQCERMFLFNGNELCYRLIKDFATWAAQKGGVNGRCWNHNGNICWTLWSGLLGYTWLGISLEIQHMIQRFISVLKLRLSLINLEGMMLVFLQLERSELTTWEVTSTQVQKHTLGAEGVLPRG